MFGAAWLCGIGFTMSLFVAGLAFEDDALLSISKIAILGASVAAGVGGCIVLTRSSPKTTTEPVEQ
jgi:NhaA family Na+:H+ antiporter